MASSDFPENQKGIDIAEHRHLLAIMYNSLDKPENYLALYLVLGKEYTEGKVSPQDYVEGYKWFVLAAEQGNKDAIEARDLLEKKMNASQISESQILVEEIRLKGTMKVKACTKCNRLKPESAFCRIAARKDGRHSVCKECDKKRSAQYVKLPEVRAKREEWRIKKVSEGYYLFGKGGIAKLRYGANKRGIPFSLTPEVLEEWWKSTPDVCCYCNLTIEEYIKIRDFVHNYRGTNNNILKYKKFLSKAIARSKRMTIERKDNQKGYEIDNIAKACWFCNSLKSHYLNEEDFSKDAPQRISDLKKEILKENAQRSDDEKEIKP